MEEKEVCFGGSDALLATSCAWLDEAGEEPPAVDELDATGGMM